MRGGTQPDRGERAGHPGPRCKENRSKMYLLACAILDAPIGVPTGSRLAHDAVGVALPRIVLRIPRGIPDEKLYEVRSFRIEICECHAPGAIYDLNIVIIEFNVRVENPVE